MRDNSLKEPLIIILNNSDLPLIQCGESVKRCLDAKMYLLRVNKKLPMGLKWLGSRNHQKLEVNFGCFSKSLNFTVKIRALPDANTSPKQDVPGSKGSTHSY